MSTHPLPPAGDEHTLYIIDISGYVFRAYHALPPLTSPRGEPTHAVLGVTSMLLKLLQERQPALVAVAMDSRGKSFRNDLFPDYKANRPPAPEDLKQQMERVGQVVEAFSIALLQREGMEADDIIASTARWARDNHLGVVIVSADKDMLQLVGDRVWMLDTMRDKVFGAAETEDKLGVPPPQVRDFLALVGDSSDNVPGVPSVGPKTARALLQEYEDLDGIYRHLDRIQRKSLRQKLAENRDGAYLSRRLVTLRDDLDLGLNRRRLAHAQSDTVRLKGLFAELGFTRLSARLEGGNHTGAAASETAEGEVRAGSQGRELAVATMRTQRELEALRSRLGTARALSLVTLTDGRPRVEADLLGLALAWYEVPSAPAQAPDTEPESHSGAVFRKAIGSGSTIHVAYVPCASTAGDVHAGQEREQCLGALKALLEDPDVPKVSADAKGDVMALAKSRVDLQGVVFDTMIASYLLDPERRAHGLKDVARKELDLNLSIPSWSGAIAPGAGAPAVQMDLDALAEMAGEMAAATLRCAEKIQPRLADAGCADLMRQVEIPLCSVLAEMELTGIRVDIQHLSDISREVEQELVGIEARCHRLAARHFNVASPRQLEVILFDELQLPVIKRTKSARSTDRDALEELAIYHDLPASVLEYRSLAKLKNTYLDTLPKQVRPRTGRIHTQFHQAVTATGRLSSSDPNLQNIPVRTPLGRSIRNAFVAREGWQILSADYSQIELRVLAHLSRDSELCRAFASGLDVHARTAQAVFGVSQDSVTREMRAQAKTINFAVIYGQTVFALARSLRIERSRAARYIEAFFQRYAGVSAYMEKVVADARESGFVRTLYGRRRPLPDLGSSNRVRREQAERIARNTPIQGTAADIIKLAMVAVRGEMRRRQMQSKMLLTVHDELVFEAPSEEKSELGQLVGECMENAAALDVPLVVEQGWGRSWGEAH